MSLGYVLPLKWRDDTGLTELTEYLRWLATKVEVVVVDGSPPLLFRRHAARWAGYVTHLRPDPDLACANGKVSGVRTGLRRIGAENVVIADDDVRYDTGSLAEVTRLLADADVVVPQNFFAPLPWHARWDSARSLINRAFGHDYPGTLAVRKSLGDYDGDVLFENLELLRTAAARGGRVRYAPDVFVRRVPPTVDGFRSQRVRQAYDSFAQPARLAAELAVLPGVLAAIARGRADLLAGAAVLATLVAEIGRRRDGGTAVFSASCAWFAPLWVAERAVCSWLAVGARLGRGGVRYGEGRISRAAHSRKYLAALAARGTR